MLTIFHLSLPYKPAFLTTSQTTITMSSNGFIPPPPDDLFDASPQRTVNEPSTAIRYAAPPTPVGTPPTSRFVTAAAAAAAMAAAAQAPATSAGSHGSQATNLGSPDAGTSFSVEAYEAAAAATVPGTPSKSTRVSVATPSTTHTTHSMSSPSLSSNGTYSISGEKRLASSPTEATPLMKRFAVDNVYVSGAPSSQSSPGKPYTLANYKLMSWDFKNEAMIKALYLDLMKLEGDDDTNHLDRCKTLIWDLKPTQLVQLIQVLKPFTDLDGMLKNDLRDLSLTLVTEKVIEVLEEKEMMPPKPPAFDTRAPSLLKTDANDSELASDRYVIVSFNSLVSIR